MARRPITTTPLRVVHTFPEGEDDLRLRLVDALEEDRETPSVDPRLYLGSDETAIEEHRELIREYWRAACDELIDALLTGVDVTLTRDGVGEWDLEAHTPSDMRPFVRYSLPPLRVGKVVRDVWTKELMGYKYLVLEDSVIRPVK